MARENYQVSYFKSMQLVEIKTLGNCFRNIVVEYARLISNLSALLPPCTVRLESFYTHYTRWVVRKLLSMTVSRQFVTIIIISSKVGLLQV